MKTLDLFLQQFPELTIEEKVKLAELLDVRNYSKGTVLLAEGQIADECYTILRGCVREYRMIDGEEQTTAFFTEGDPVVSFTSFTNKIPADHYFVCTEESELLVGGNPEKDAELFRQFPVLEQIIKSRMQQELGKTRDSFAHFVAATPEERFLNLYENRADLFQRVPQHQLASYLGISPEAFSRIKKRILQSGATKE